MVGNKKDDALFDASDDLKSSGPVTEGGPQVEDQQITVGAPKAKSILVLAGVVGIVLYVLYSIAFTGGGEQKAEEKGQPVQTQQEAQEAAQKAPPKERPPEKDDIGEAVNVVSVPDLPEAPAALPEAESKGSDKITAATEAEAPLSNELFENIFADPQDKQAKAPESGPQEELEIFEPARKSVTITQEKPEDDSAIPPPQPLPPQQVMAPQQPPPPTPEQVAAAKEAEDARIAHQKFLYEQPLTAVFTGDGTPSSPVNAAGERPVAHTAEALQIAATTIGDGDKIIGQGKMIEAVLETAVNTDLDGSVRAVISRDIYSETGREILLPRGTRLIGAYSSDVRDDQSRLPIIWTRIMRPDGVDINLASSPFRGGDQLGRSGVAGIVDRKYFEMFSSSALFSLLTVGLASVAEQISDSDATDTTSITTSVEGNTTSTTTRSISDEAVLAAVAGLNDTAKDMVTRSFGKKPTIIIAQGTRLRVFVGKDIIFPDGHVRYMR